MTTIEISIDLTRLEKSKHHASGKITARCPACAAHGGDRRGEHLFVNLATGKWGCAAFPGDGEHRREIFALVGLKGERRPDPARDRDWREARRRERREAEARAKLAQTAGERRAAICERWRWDAVDVWESSPQRIDCDLVALDPRHFLATMFPPDAVVWTGQAYQSGERSADRWRTVAEWQATPRRKVGPMTTAATWEPGTISRAHANVLDSPFCVLDFDGLPRPDALAICRWLREDLQWHLAALLWTGGKSIHAWFHNPGNEQVESLRTVAPSLGIDAGLLGHPEHPCRLPGQRHEKSAGVSGVLWLQIPGNI